MKIWLGLAILVCTSPVCGQTLQIHESSLRENTLRLHISGATPPLTAETLKLSREGEELEVGSLSAEAYKEKELPVGVVFVFPITLNYDEGLWQIRTELTRAVEKHLRPVDAIGFIGYDSYAKRVIKPKAPGSRQALEETTERVRQWEETEEPQPNLYSALSAGLRMLEEAVDENNSPVAARFLVVISDAEGAITDTPKAAKTLQKARDLAEATGVTLVVVAYYFDEEEGRFFPKLEELGAPPHRYATADRTSALEAVLDAQVGALTDIHLIRIELAELPPPGKHTLDVSVGSEQHASFEVKVPYSLKAYKGKGFSPRALCGAKGEKDLELCTRLLTELQSDLEPEVWRAVSVCVHETPADDKEGMKVCMELAR